MDGDRVYSTQRVILIGLVLTLLYLDAHVSAFHTREQPEHECRFARNAVATGRKSSSAGRRRLRDLVLGDVRFAAHALRLRHRVRAVLLDRIVGPFGRV